MTAFHHQSFSGRRVRMGAKHAGGWWAGHGPLLAKNIIDKRRECLSCPSHDPFASPLRVARVPDQLHSPATFNPMQIGLAKTVRQANAKTLRLHF